MADKRNFLIVNFFTVLRAVGIIALIPIFINMGGVVAATIAATCYLTDFIDGFLARKLHASTFFGSMFDGITDKAFNLVNFGILLSITPLAIIPIIIELGIIVVQKKKYQEKMNVKSNMTGKLKMWVAAITVILSYFLVDLNSLNFMSTELITKISEINPSLLFGATITPLIISEVATFLSYINELVNGLKEPINEKTNIPLKEDTLKTELEQREIEISNEKELLIGEKEKLYTMKELLFSPSIYDEYKDQDGLKLVLDKVKKNKSNN
ncbi:MAG: CDP-alcohol phosphatidyltransferase family protein [Bacilli bacterium]